MRKDPSRKRGPSLRNDCCKKTLKSASFKQSMPWTRAREGGLAWQGHPSLAHVRLLLKPNFSVRAATAALRQVQVSYSQRTCRPKPWTDLCFVPDSCSLQRRPKT